MSHSVPPASHNQPLQRVMIIGSPGSGKSTLARQLGMILGIDVVHLDRYFWQPGWIETPRDEWRAVQIELVQRPRWIMDGNYSATQDVRLAVADTIIFLDLPRSLCLWRVLKRRVQYHGRTRPDLPPECPEALDWKLLQILWSYPTIRRAKIMERLRQHTQTTRIVILRSPTDVRRFLHNIKREQAMTTTSLHTGEPR